MVKGISQTSPLCSIPRTAWWKETMLTPMAPTTAEQKLGNTVMCLDSALTAQICFRRINPDKKGVTYSQKLRTEIGNNPHNGSTPPLGSVSCHWAHFLRPPPYYTITMRASFQQTLGDKSHPKQTKHRSVSGGRGPRKNKAPLNERARWEET